MKRYNPNLTAEQVEFLKDIARWMYFLEQVEPEKVKPGLSKREAREAVRLCG